MRLCAHLIICTLAACLSGCIVGPDYFRPHTEVPQEWRPDESTTAELQAEACWWLGFGDSTLDQLMSEAVDNNLSLREAALRIAQARYQRCVVRGDLFPQFDGETAYNFQKQPTTGGLTGQLVGDDGGGGGFQFDDTFDQYSMGLNGSWEIDIFGRLRRNVQAARAEVCASVWAYRDTMVLMLAEVATNYVDARAFQRRLAIAQENLKAQQRSLEITQKRFEAELISELDVAQARANVETTRAEIPTLEIGYQQAVNRLSVLLGRAPGYVDELLSGSQPIPQPPGEVAVGIPADLLRRRPDIRQAEYTLVAQVARIGAAKADLFPSLSLTGSFGVQSQRVNNLFTDNSISANVGPTLRWNLLNFGRVRCNIRLQDALATEYVAAYQRTVLEAAEEVDNALINYTRQQKRQSALADSVAALERAVELAVTQYQRGTVDFQRVLDSQRSLLQAQDQLATTEGEVTASLIELYRALGGGWDCPQQREQIVAVIPLGEIELPTTPEPVPTDAVEGLDAPQLPTDQPEPANAPLELEEPTLEPMPELENPLKLDDVLLLPTVPEPIE
ncbi:efflux transporter outer membrane subunit [Aeoliella mucimassa]|uniref:Toluene efflux pump outer membrane protein TtgF n=1 Tax=Aeoliella mucimassa TaxID=2527972 RepID=A0A518ASE7_9BACT|nr:efflux transporter outer membrane subunit [Aeoliella mucimassa]QDU57654.1 Toluene efflux pump outer membrane protein TtgF precursor [Aeoliella mucimassa]